ncbi:hypothetical protein C4572_02540 [Candidatus Parcubacteria bacterium]|nr:MAG: hypothetical protein C4572_02540 [Candidatus Parcubacteria bacterium]
MYKNKDNRIVIKKQLLMVVLGLSFLISSKIIYAYPESFRWTEGRVGSHALVFNSARQNHLRVNNSASIDFDTISFSVSLWFKTETPPITDAAPLITKNSWRVNMTPSGQIQFLAGCQPQSGASYADGQWHHLVAVRDRNTNQCLLYLDDIMVSSTAIIGSITANPDDIIIGGSTVLTRYFTGELDDIRLYSKALTPADVSSLYSSSDLWQYCQNNSQCQARQICDDALSYVQADSCDACTDPDSDGICTDGDPSADNPCRGGETQFCDDNCKDVSNPGQEDENSDGIGDLCDTCTYGLDFDNDTVADVCDNCPETYNPGQGDVDSDGRGDECDCDSCTSLFDDGIPDEILAGPGECVQTFSSNINLVQKWHWGDNTTGGWDNVMMSPVVADLNSDGREEIIFTVFYGGNYTMGNTGRLVVLDGATGSYETNFLPFRPDGSSPINVCTGCQIAVADLDNNSANGLEILVPDVSGNYLLAYHYGNSGTGYYQLWWTSAAVGGGGIIFGAAAVANLDGTLNDEPEIVIGARVLNYDGTLRWSAGNGVDEAKTLAAGPISVVADVNLDGYQEVVTGQRIINRNGTTLCTFGIDGFPAVANVNSTAQPEIAIAYNGRIYMFNYLCSQLGLTGSFSDRGGPPTIGNFDTDPEAEIANAHNDDYLVFERDGAVKWRALIDDDSSRATGSTLFDFNNDGKMEVLYRDEQALHIFDSEGNVGADSNGDGYNDAIEITQVRSGSGTLFEYPLVVNIDTDTEAEIILPANNFDVNIPTDNAGDGVSVWEAGIGTQWNSTRSIWNQHSYHITNINDDGTVPQVEQNNWDVYNNYRVNAQPPQYTQQPDLTASIISIRDFGDGYMEIDVRIRNVGEAAFPAGESYVITLLDQGVIIDGETVISGLGVGADFQTTLGGYLGCSGGIDLDVRVVPIGVVECDAGNNEDSYNCSCSCETSFTFRGCVPTEAQEFSCSDRSDNDCDSYIDLADSNCTGASIAANASVSLGSVNPLYYPSLDLQGRGHPNPFADIDIVNYFDQDFVFSSTYRFRLFFHLLESGQQNIADYINLFRRIDADGGKIIIQLYGMPASLTRCYEDHVLDPSFCTQWDAEYAWTAYPPKDWGIWENLIYNTIDRISYTEGIDNVYYEVWNEPDLGYWWGTELEYFMLYEYSVNAVRRFEQNRGLDVKIGGPVVSHWDHDINGSGIDIDEDLLKADGLLYRFISYADSRDLSVDFISFHHYANNLDVLEHHLNAEYFTRKWLSELGFNPDTPIILDEWNTWGTDGSSRTYLRDNEITASFIPAYIRSMESAGMDDHTFFSLQDFDVAATEFHGDFGLMTLYGVKKPSYHVMNLLEKMKNGSQISTTVNNSYFVDSLAVNDNGTIMLMAWNHIPIEPQPATRYYLESIGLTEDVLLSEGLTAEEILRINKYIFDGVTPLPSVSPSTLVLIEQGRQYYLEIEDARITAQPVSLGISGLDSSKIYSVDEYIIDASHSNSYQLKDVINAAIAGLTTDAEKLAAAQNFNLDPRADLTVANNYAVSNQTSFNLDLNMEPYSVHYFEIKEATFPPPPPPPPPDPAGLLFFSSWNTMLGTSEAALSDGGKWVLAPDSILQTPYVSSGGPGGNNYLNMVTVSSGYGSAPEFNWYAENLADIFHDPSNLYLRFYFRVHDDYVLESPNKHWFEINVPGDLGNTAAFSFNVPAVGELPSLAGSPFAIEFSKGRFTYSQPMETERWYCYEVLIEEIGGGERYYIRLDGIDITREHMSISGDYYGDWLGDLYDAGAVFTDYYHGALWINTYDNPLPLNQGWDVAAIEFRNDHWVGCY